MERPFGPILKAKQRQIEETLGVKIEIGREGQNIYTGTLPGVAILKNGKTTLVSEEAETRGGVVRKLHHALHQARGDMAIVKVDKSGNRGDMFRYDQSRRAFSRIDPAPPRTPEARRVTRLLNTIKSISLENKLMIKDFKKRPPFRIRFDRSVALMARERNDDLVLNPLLSNAVLIEKLAPRIENAVERMNNPSLSGQHARALSTLPPAPPEKVPPSERIPALPGVKV